MNPTKFAQMMKYLTRVKKEKPDLPDVFPASKAPIPPVREDVETTKMFNRFNQANPRTEKADGGMLVKPGFGGTRQGYREARLRSSEKKIIQTQVIDSYNKLVNYAVNNRKIKNFAEPVEIMVKGKIKKFNYLPSIEEFAKITETQPRFFYQQPTTVAERKAGGKQKLLVIANKKQAFKKIVDDTIKLHNQTYKFMTEADIAKAIGYTDKDTGTGVYDLIKNKKVTKPFSRDEIVGKYIQHLVDSDAPLKDFSITNISKHINSENTKVGKGARNISTQRIYQYIEKNNPEIDNLLKNKLRGWKQLVREHPSVGNVPFSEAIENINDLRNNAIKTTQYLSSQMSRSDILAAKLKLDQKSLSISNAQDAMVKSMNEYVKKFPEVILNNPKFQNFAAMRVKDGKLVYEKNPEIILKRLEKYIKKGFFSTDHKNPKREGKLNVEFPTNKQIVPTFTNSQIKSMNSYIANNVSKYNDAGGIVKNNIDEMINFAKNNNFTIRVPKGYSKIFGTTKLNIGLPEVSTIDVNGNLKSYDVQLKNYGINVDDIPELSKIKNVNYLSPTEFTKKTTQLKKALDFSQNQLLKDKRVVPPKSRPGQGGFIATELIPGVTKGSRRVIGGAAGFVLPEVLFYQLDKRNRMSKGVSEEEAEAAALQSASLGALKDTAYMNNLKKVGESMGVDSRSFDAAYDMNVLLKNYEQNNLNFQDQYLNLLETGDEKRALDLEKNFDEYKKRTQNQYALLSNNISDNVMNTVGASPLIMEQGRRNITQEQFEKPFKDLQKAGLEKLKREKIKASRTQKRQVDPTAGSIGENFYQAFDSLTQGAKNLLQGRVIPFASKIGFPQYEPQASQREILSDTLQNLSNRDLERFNLGRGYVQSDPVSDLDLQNLAIERPGLFYAGGGIAKLAGDRSGPPPERGPNSQGLQGLMKRVRNL